MVSNKSKIQAKLIKSKIQLENLKIRMINYDFEANT